MGNLSVVLGGFPFKWKYIFDFFKKSASSHKVGMDNRYDKINSTPPSYSYVMGDIFLMGMDMARSH